MTATEERPGRAPAEVARNTGWRTWSIAGLAAAGTIASRAPHLTRPGILVFDELYYAEQAREIAIWGVERGHTVHPPLGKWLIAAGVRAFGFTPLGWRIVPLLAGGVVVGATVVAARRLVSSDALALLAGLIVATDGIAVVDGRLALLDGLLAALTTAGLAVILATASRPAEEPLRLRASITLGCLLGAATAVKWSALPLVALSALWLGWRVRRRRPPGPVRRRELTRVGLTLGALPLAVYALTYVPTLFAYHDSGVRREVCAGRAVCDDSLLGRIEGIAADQVRIARFHHDLQPRNRFAASALHWVVQTHPTALLVSTCDGRGDPVCAGDDRPGAMTVRRIVAAGNPLVWVTGTESLVACAAVAWRRRRAPIALPPAWAGAMWLPWIAGARGGYSFYAVVVVPTLALATVSVLGMLDARARRIGAGATAAVCLLGAVLAWPSWTAAPVPADTLFGWIERLVG